MTPVRKAKQRRAAIWNDWSHRNLAQEWKFSKRY